jgi:polysaccharide pyruvyl transferase WcaK-like protein
MQFLLVGNYGTGNLGDELLREYFLKTFSEVEWTVVVADAGCRLQVADTTIPRLPFGLRSLLTTPWWRTIAALRRSDGMVFGGGTLFTDIESVKAPMLWWWHAFFAWIFRKKIILAFQGIGPFRTGIGAWCSRWVVARAELTIVRDAESFQRIASWKKKRCVLSFDPVLSLFAAEKREVGGSVFVVIPRANATQEFMERATVMWQQRKGEWSGVRIVSLEPENADEVRICDALARSMQASVVAVKTFEELRDALRDAAYVLTQRYHGAIAAMGLGVVFEAVPQQAGDKLEAVQGMDRSEALQSITVGEQALREAFHL